MFFLKIIIKNCYQQSLLVCYQLCSPHIEQGFKNVSLEHKIQIPYFKGLILFSFLLFFSDHLGPPLDLFRTTTYHWSVKTFRKQHFLKHSAYGLPQTTSWRASSACLEWRPNKEAAGQSKEAGGTPGFGCFHSSGSEATRLFGKHWKLFQHTKKAETFLFHFCLIQWQTGATDRWSWWSHLCVIWGL